MKLPASLLQTLTLAVASLGTAGCDQNLSNSSGDQSLPTNKSAAPKASEPPTPANLPKASDPSRSPPILLASSGRAIKVVTRVSPVVVGDTRSG